MEGKPNLCQLYKFLLSSSWNIMEKLYNLPTCENTHIIIQIQAITPLNNIWYLSFSARNILSYGITILYVFVLTSDFIFSKYTPAAIPAVLIKF